MKLPIITLALSSLCLPLALAAPTASYVTGFARGGEAPSESIPVLDSAGNAYFTTAVGGRAGDGTIIRVAPNGTETTLAHFDVNDQVRGAGARTPRSGVVLGPAGDDGLYGTTTSGGSSTTGVSTVFRYDLGDGTLRRLAFIPGSSGAGPCRLVLASDGKFYGHTLVGGANADGNLISIAPSVAGDYNGAFTLTELAVFTGPNATASPTEGQSPVGQLTERVDGGTPFLYGVISSSLVGGDSNRGRVYKFALPAAGATSATLIPVAVMPQAFEGNVGGLTKAADGSLYGATSSNTNGLGGGFGGVYRIDAAGALSAVGFFTSTSSPGSPSGPPLVGADGFIYGGLGSGSSLFRMNPANGQHVIILNLTGDTGAAPGSQPYGLVRRPDGTLVCLCLRGGISDGAGDTGGVLFSLSGSGVGPYTYTKLWDALRIAPLYGPANPRGGLVSDGRVFYGTSFEGGQPASVGGSTGDGTIYSFNPASGAVTTLHRFRDLAVPLNTGYRPDSTLLRLADGALYGTTTTSGLGNGGTLFRYRPAVGATAASFATLVDFNGTTASGVRPAGSDAAGALVDGGDGFLYGTTSEGGTAGNGTIFRMALADNSVQTLAQFTNIGGAAPGRYPFCGLTPVRNGAGVATLFYGVTSGGRSSSGTAGGVLFSITPTGTYTALADFVPATGTTPYGALLLHNGLLYGVASASGSGSSGTLYRYDPATPNSLIAVFNFSTATNTGRQPKSALMVGPDGWIYGTTESVKSGVAVQNGTIFRYRPADDTVEELTAFTGIHYPGETATGPAGKAPLTGALALGPDCALYGTTSQLGDGFGGIFRVAAWPIYSQWLRDTYPNGGYAGDNADPDGDSITNLVEYMTGSDPNVRGGNPIENSQLATRNLGISGTKRFYFFEHYQRAPMDPDFTLVPWSSTDLQSWTALPFIPGFVLATDEGAYYQRDIGNLLEGTPPLCRGAACRYFGRVPASGERTFVRLRAVTPKR